MRIHAFNDAPQMPDQSWNPNLCSRSFWETPLFTLGQIKSPHACLMRAILWSKKVLDWDSHPCHFSYFSNDSAHLTIRHKCIFKLNRFLRDATFEYNHCKIPTHVFHRAWESMELKSSWVWDSHPLHFSYFLPHSEDLTMRYKWISISKS